MPTTIFRVRKIRNHNIEPLIEHGIVKHPKCLGMPCLNLKNLSLNKNDKLFFSYRGQNIYFCLGYFQEIHDRASGTCHSVEEIHKMHRKPLRENRLELGWRNTLNPIRDLQPEIRRSKEEKRKKYESSK